MNIDPNNPVVKLCGEGIQAEMAGKKEEAANFYARAWEKASNDYESCIVAHYMARVQETPNNILHWNQEALNFADKVSDESVETFYPSLYLNMGKACEDLGNKEDAKRYYTLAQSKTSVLPNDTLGNKTREGILKGLERVSE